jgi:hypothetical protein
MWSDYFLDLLPNESQPEALKRLTVLPEYDNMDGRYGWSTYLHGGDKVLMRDTVVFFANKLGVTNSSLSLEEKAKRIAEWAYSGERANSVIDRVGKYDGYTYDCVTQSDGLTAIYRLAGIPAISIDMALNNKWHVESFFFLNGVWHNSIIYGDHELTFTDYFSSVHASWVTDICGFGYDTTYMVDEDADPILDLNETWIDVQAERFMLNLLRQPYAYPEKKLTRGEVAKILCNFIGTVPMKNDQIYIDVPTTHQYSRYIWAMKQLGIMNGNGDGTFRPDSELSMQEFAVMAIRVLEYRSQILVEETTEELRNIKNNPIDWPPDLQYTKDVVQRLEKEIDWKTRVAKISSPDPIIFVDNADIATWAKSAVDDFSKLGILQGDSAGSGSRLRPTEAINKTRFLVFLAKFEQKLQLFNSSIPTPTF